MAKRDSGQRGAGTEGTSMTDPILAGKPKPPEGAITSKNFADYHGGYRVSMTQHAGGMTYDVKHGGKIIGTAYGLYGLGEALEIVQQHRKEAPPEPDKQTEE